MLSANIESASESNNFSYVLPQASQGARMDRGWIIDEQIKYWIPNEFNSQWIQDTHDIKEPYQAQDTQEPDEISHPNESDNIIPKRQKYTF